MALDKYLPAILIVGALIGIGINQYFYDKDLDGVPNNEDIFPNDSDEWEDTDKDGIGDNEDVDDDNDGYNDTNDLFPKDYEEYYDNDLDGIGNNKDLDDDNDGYNDDVDLDILNDIALKFNFEWIELNDKQSSKTTAPVIIYLLQDSKEIHRFDNNNKPWAIPWQEKYILDAEFELNIPDDKAEHNFTIKAMYYKFRNPEEFDISSSNESYNANITYNLTTKSWELGKNGTLDGNLDYSNEANNAKLFLNIEAYNFGYFKSYNWFFNTIEYQINYNFDSNRYSYFTTQSHLVKEYKDYLNFVTSDEEAIIDIAHKLNDISKENDFDNLTQVNFFLSFVQSLKYSEDNLTAGVGEYPRYPIETLIDQTGDCEDTSALLISLIEAINYKAAIILIPEAWEGYGHAAVGISVDGASGVHYILNEGTSNEISYYYAETTAPGWKLGEIPDLDSNKAYIYEAK